MLSESLLARSSRSLLSGTGVRSLRKRAFQDAAQYRSRVQTQLRNQQQRQLAGWVSFATASSEQPETGNISSKIQLHGFLAAVSSTGFRQVSCTSSRGADDFQPQSVTGCVYGTRGLPQYTSKAHGKRTAMSAASSQQLPSGCALCTAGVSGACLSATQVRAYASRQSSGGEKSLLRPVRYVLERLFLQQQAESAAAGEQMQRRASDGPKVRVAAGCDCNHRFGCIG